MRGICSVCQKAEAVVRLPDPCTDGEMWEGDDEDLYAMAEHGCDGGGTTPEKLVPLLAEGLMQAVRMTVEGELSREEFLQVLDG